MDGEKRGRRALGGAARKDRDDLPLVREDGARDGLLEGREVRVDEAAESTNRGSRA